MSEFTEVHREVLTALCDTVVPAIERADDPDGFFARSATDMGADQALLVTLGTLPPDQAAGMLQLLDALAEQGYDYAKGNRFMAGAALQGVPRHRVVGNDVLAFFNQAASGYWPIFDPEHG